MRHRQSEEHKVANLIAKALSNLLLDLEQVGIYLAREHTNTIYRRFQVVSEAAQEEKEIINGRNYIHQ